MIGAPHVGALRKFSKIKKNRKVKKMKTMKKLLVITPILALLCLAMFASITPQAKAQVVPLNSTDLAYVTGYSNIGAGSVTNPGYIVGVKDGYYAQIYGGNYGDGGEITGQMSATVASGSTVKLWEYSASGYSSNELIYGGNSASGPWTLIASGTINSATPQYWSFTTSIAFTYISVTGYDTGNSVNLFIDCVITT
jgi:hypothetical protein